MAIHINIIGAGNMAYQLTQAFHNHPEVQLQQLYNRSELSPEFNVFEIEKTHHLSTLRPADVCIIAVKDEAIAGISKKLPFENQLVIVKMKGEDIQGVFDYYEKQKRNNPVAGFTIVVENGKLKQGLINGEKPKAGQYYYIATSDYLAYGGDYMKFFLKGEQLILTEMTLRDLFIEKFKQNPEIKIKQEQRLQFIGNNQ